MVLLTPLNRFNWESYLEIQIHAAQENFVPSILFSLAQAKFENLFPLGIQLDNQIVGFVMYGNFSGIFWINRIIIDKRFQRKGIGKDAIRQLIAQFHQNPQCKEIRTSFIAENIAARKLFTELGFSPINEGVDGEIIAKLE
jgi:diamine N-acetyltransferase